MGRNSLIWTAVATQLILPHAAHRGILAHPPSAADGADLSIIHILDVISAVETPSVLYGTNAEVQELQLR